MTVLLFFVLFRGLRYFSIRWLYMIRQNVLSIKRTNILLEDFIRASLLLDLRTELNCLCVLILSVMWLLFAFSLLRTRLVCEPDFNVNQWGRIFNFWFHLVLKLIVRVLSLIMHTSYWTCWLHFAKNPKAWSDIRYFDSFKGMKM